MDGLGGFRRSFKGGKGVKSVNGVEGGAQRGVGEEWTGLPGALPQCLIEHSTDLSI